MGGLKTAGKLAMALFVAVGVPLVFWLGAAVLAKTLSPYLPYVTGGCLAVFFLLIVPFSVLAPAQRAPLGAVSFFLSYLYGGAVWLVAFAVLVDHFSAHFWMVLIVSVLFILLGGGFSTPVLLASVVSAISGRWDLVGQLVLAGILIAVMRVFSVFLMGSAAVAGVRAGGPGGRRTMDTTGRTVDEGTDGTTTRRIEDGQDDHGMDR